jgi:hypothetical protein
MVCNGEVYFHNFTQIDHGIKYNLKNIICDQNQRGLAGSGDDYHILVSAHYDSRMQDINQTNARAPGADDNASGVAAVLEHTICFVFWRGTRSVGVDGLCKISTVRQY